MGRHVLGVSGREEGEGVEFAIMPVKWMLDRRIGRGGEMRIKMEWRGEVRFSGVGKGSVVVVGVSILEEVVRGERMEESL